MDSSFEFTERVTRHPYKNTVSTDSFQIGNNDEAIPLILESISLSEEDKPNISLQSWISTFDLFPKVDPKYLKQSQVGGISTLVLYSVLLAFIFIAIYQCIFPPMISTLAIAQHDDETFSKLSKNATFDDFFINLNISIFSPCEEIAVRYALPGGYVVLVSPILQMEPIGNNSCRISGRLSLARSLGSIQFIPVSHMNLKIEPEQSKIQNVFQIDPRVSFTHTIHKLEFGNPFPNRISPLSGISSSESILNSPYSLHQYFVSIIPTTWYKKPILPFVHSSKIFSFQYAAQSYYRSLSENSATTLGIIFDIDFESVVIEQTNESYITNGNGTFGELSIFIIQLMGILGGLGALSDALYSLIGYLGTI